MEAFVSRKRRRISPQLERNPEHRATDEDDTDVKLATLASLHESIDQTVLLEALITANGSVEDASKTLKGSKPKVIGYQSSLSSFGLLGNTKPRTKKGQTLHLYAPEAIAAHTPCSIIHNFLPPDVANDLLKELLVEAPTYERQAFKVFDNVVQSPHSACFYVESMEEKQQQQTEYLYNGSYLTVCASFDQIISDSCRTSERYCLLCELFPV